jgi:hypothetical protein
MAAPSSLASYQLSRLAGVRRAVAFAPSTLAQQQVRLGCSRRRAQRVVAMAGSGKVRSPADASCLCICLAPFLSPSLRLVLPFDSALQFFVGGNWKCVSVLASSALHALGMSVLPMLEMMS